MVKREFLSKINRILCNELWDDCYPRAEALFLPERTFNHSPMVISFFPFVKRPFRFQFCNLWAHRKSFLGVVEKQWSCVVEGTLSFQIQSKLNALKRLLKAEFHNGYVKASMDAAEIELHPAQAVLHDHLGNSLFASLEVEAVAKFKQTKEDYFVHV